MKVLSYITIILGVLIFIGCFIFNISGTIGYFIALLSIFLVIIGLCINKKLLEYAFDIVMNLC